jgi:FtsP/CotA-like multicopper oxidase with cupredoxin domain
MRKAVLITAIVVALLALVFLNERHESQTPVLIDNSYKISQTQLDALSPVEESQVVVLNDGDTYTIDATLVKETIEGKIIKRLAYNGQIPGPLLKVKQNSTVTIIHNNFTDEETSLHFHGLRGKSEFDGAAPLTQDPIAVGGSFTYELEFPDSGVYWYHPHVREDYSQELGMYGNVIVSNDDDWDYLADEKYLILDDFDETIPFFKNKVTHTLMGRFGSRLLVNNKEDYKINLMVGQVGRLFLTNASNTRTFDLKFEGTKIKIVGGDNGKAHNEQFVENVIIATSERFIVEVLYNEPGTYPVLHRGKKLAEVIVAPSTDTISENTYETLKTSAEDYVVITRNLDEYLAQIPEKTLRIDLNMGQNLHSNMNSGTTGESKEIVTIMGMEQSLEQAIEHCKMMPNMPECETIVEGDEHSETEAHGNEGIEWEDDMNTMNRISDTENIEWQLIDEETGDINQKIDWKFKKGDMVKMEILNDPTSMHPMQHPVHIHGQRFVVLTRDGVANNDLQWKDTVLVKTGETVEILVDMSNVGDWMIHCHISEHNAAGMMFDFVVE